MGWHIVVDEDLCQGHGVCESEAPGVFEVSKAGDLTIVERSPGEDRRSEVDMAVKYCPTHALKIITESHDASAPEPKGT